MKVSIVLSDEGWVLERLAREITDRLGFATHGLRPESDADIVYYMTYGARRAATAAEGAVEVGYFTHREEEEPARSRFVETARAMRACVCQSRVYADLLEEHGVAGVRVIQPGVDLERFAPRLRIGVVGRTYHTGRKGEHLVQAVAELPFVELHATGAGWPVTPRPLAEADMPAFYQEMDYILVPSLVEGGPMCVVEALACGKEVIAPAVGWVPQFPHIPYRTGDLASLREVLERLHERRLALRRSVEHLTWESWARGHEALFVELARENGLSPRSPAPARRRLRVAHVLHGREPRSRGGPSVRVPRTAERLRAAGIEASVVVHPHDPLPEADVYHLYNLWHPASALRAMEALRPRQRGGARLVLSPIFLDLSRRELWEEGLTGLFADAEGPEALDAALGGFREILARADTRPGLAAAEPWPGYASHVRELLRAADHVVCLSAREERQLEVLAGRPLASVSLVRNPADPDAFAGADGASFGQRHGLGPYALCVGRVEARKNQLVLAHALAGADVPLVLAGHAGSQDYLDLVRRYGGGRLRHLGRLEPSSPELLAAYAGAAAVVGPSWAEGASLAALEGAAAGARLVLSDRSGEREYFGDDARYVDPADPGAIRAAVEDVLCRPAAPRERAERRARVGEALGWEAHIAGLKRVYAGL